MYLVTFNIKQINEELLLARTEAQAYFDAHPRLAFAPKGLEEFQHMARYKELTDKITPLLSKVPESMDVQGEFVEAVWTNAGEIIYIVYYGEKFHTLKETQVIKVVRLQDQGQVPFTVSSVAPKIGEVIKVDPATLIKG